MSRLVIRYLPLLEAFVGAEISADEFQAQFRALWRENPGSGLPFGDVLDGLMTEVDRYDADPNVIGRIDDAQLRVEARKAIAGFGHPLPISSPVRRRS